jgi:hypothetical protein
MVHSGYEATAVMDAARRPWKALPAALRGPRTTGPMAPEIPLKGQRPAEYVFSRHVEQALAEAHPSQPAGPRGAVAGGIKPPQEVAS